HVLVVALQVGLGRELARLVIIRHRLDLKAERIAQFPRRPRLLRRIAAGFDVPKGHERGKRQGDGNERDPAHGDASARWGWASIVVGSRAWEPITQRAMLRSARAIGTAIPSRVRDGS